MSEEANNSNVQVEIFDQAFKLRGSDTDYILKLAEYVDAKMRVIADKTSTTDRTRLAVLAALNIADEYHRLKPSPKPVSEEEKQRNRERRRGHYTRRTHEKKLLAIVNGESVPPKERRKALFELGMCRGYQQPPAKRRA